MDDEYNLQRFVHAQEPVYECYRHPASDMGMQSHVQTLAGIEHGWPI